jgi:hypothetical protein
MNKSESKYYNTAVLMDEALLILLETKDFEFITVKEICKKAGVNRSTFYLHYQNTAELLAEATQLINKRFTESFQLKSFDAINANKESSFFITPEYIVPYLNFVKKNKKLFRLIHEKPYIFNNEKAFEKLYKNIFSVILDKYGVKEDKKQYIFSFYTQGTLAIIMKWLENDCKDEIDNIVGIIIDLIGHNSINENY